MTDTTRIITGETHSWGVEVTSGAGQIELVAISSRSVATVTLTEEQAEQLAADLLSRVNRMHELRRAEAER